MPKKTFYNLPEEKRNKIIEAAKEEFSRVPVHEASIKNIVENSGIARGSFYQYFDSKEDLFDVVFEELGKFKEYISGQLKQEKIDLFDFNTSIYTYLIRKLRKKENVNFAKEVFRNVKVSEIDYLRLSKNKEAMPAPLESDEFIGKVDCSLLNIEGEENIRRLNRILFFITRGMLATSFQYKTTKEAEEEYRSTIDFLKEKFSKYNLYADEISKTINKPGVNIKATFEFLKDKYPELDWNYNGLKDFINRHQLKDSNNLKAHVRFETGPGEELQVDWKESLKLHNRTGNEYLFNIFSATLSYSREHLFVYSLTRTTEDFIRCLIDVLKRTGLPKRILTDNMGAIVSIRNKPGCGFLP